MKSCSIVNIPDEVWKRFRAKCVIEGTTINDKVLQFIKQEAEKPLEEGK